MTLVTRVESGNTRDAFGNPLFGAVTVITEDNGDNIVYPAPVTSTNERGELVIDTRAQIAAPPHPLLAQVGATVSQQVVRVNTETAQIVPDGVEEDNPHVRLLTVTTVETHAPVAAPVENSPVVEENPEQELNELQQENAATNNVVQANRVENNPAPQPDQVVTTTEPAEPTAQHLDAQDTSPVAPLHGETISPHS